MGKIREVAKAGLSSISGISALLVFSVLVISILLQQAGSVSPVVQPSGYVLVGEKSYWENQYAHINVSKHVTQRAEMINGTSYYAPLFNFTWKAADNNIDIGFVFDFPVTGGFDTGVFQSFNLTVANCTAVITQFDNVSNSSLYNVTSTACNAFVGTQLGQTYSWTDRTAAMTHVERAGQHYYFFQNVPVTTNQLIMGRLKIAESSIPDDRPVKFGIVGKLTSDSIATAISSARFISLDPIINGNKQETGLWVMNDTSDNSPSGYTLTNTGGTVFSACVDCRGKASNYTGSTSQYLQLADNSVIQVEGGNFSILCRANVSSLVGDRLACWSKRGNAGSTGIDVTVDKWTATTLKFHIFDVAGSVNTFSSELSYFNKFHNWAVTYDKTNQTLRLYVDGVLDSQRLTPATFTPGTSVAYIGFDNPPVLASYGMIDTLYLFNVTLNDSDIVALNNSLSETNLTTALSSSGGSNAANETQGNTAIELGINISLPSATKYSSQQVYVRNLSNNQTLGTFDWVASYSNQRWLLNYITSGESYANAPNLSTAVYVLEMANLTSAQITNQVSSLINATKQ